MADTAQRQGIPGKQSIPCAAGADEGRREENDLTQDECKNLDELVATLVKYHPEADVELVKKAYHFAEKAHAGRASRTLFIR